MTKYKKFTNYEQKKNIWKLDVSHELQDFAIQFSEFKILGFWSTHLFSPPRWNYLGGYITVMYSIRKDCAVPL